MSAITRMMQRIFGKVECRNLIVGLDAAGKTTVLYKLKLGEVVTTIPTIGFNVETVEYKQMAMTMWDVGGCDKIRPLWRHYFQGTDALICVVDSNDRDRMEDAGEELQRLLSEDELRGAHLLVYANKQDLPRAMPAHEIAERLGLQGLRGRSWHIQAACATTGDGLYEGLDWLYDRLRSGRDQGGGSGGGGGGGGGGEGPAAQPRAKPETEEEREKRHREELLVEWLEREDNDDEEFLGQLADYTLDAWDHRTHLRIAWLLLGRHGRKDGLPKIFDSIRSFIANSKRTQRSRGTTFHETMTYFWVHMVHYAMEVTANPTGDFKGFLFMNPQLSNGGLFLHYYSKELMLHSPAARMEVALPDKRPLPSLISGVEPGRPVRPLEERLAPGRPLDDAAFLESFRAGRLPSWGHEAKLRALWCLLREHGRQRGGTERVLEALRQAEGSGHHVTAGYFWLQMVTLADAKAAGVGSYAQFVQLPTSQKLLNPDLIDKHYSDRALADGASDFRTPDKKPLPSFVR